jgi:hypothetical protein
MLIKEVLWGEVMSSPQFPPSNPLRKHPIYRHGIRVIKSPIGFIVLIGNKEFDHYNNENSAHKDAKEIETALDSRFLYPK